MKTVVLTGVILPYLQITGFNAMDWRVIDDRGGISGILPAETTELWKPLRRWCQVLRRNCEIDWAQKYPQYVVSCWIGHDIAVSAKHYLQVPEQLYNQASATNLRQTATKTATIQQRES